MDMQITTIAIINIILGTILLFFGNRFVRLVLGLFGVAFGLVLGNVLAGQLNLGGVFHWVISIALAILFASLSVRFYKFLIRFFIALTFFIITCFTLLAFNATGLLAFVTALIVGALAFVLVKQLKLIDLMFMFITSVNGSATLLSGIVLLIGSTDSAELRQGHITDLIQQSPFWVIPWIALFIAGFWFQHKNYKPIRAE